MVLQETFVVVDADLYLPCTSDISSYFNIPSGMQGKITYGSSGMTITDLGSYQTMSLNTSYNAPVSVEFEIVAHTGSAPNVVYGKIGNNWIYTEMNTNKTQVDFCGTKYNVGNTVGKYKIEIDTSEVRFYKDTTLIHTYSGTLSALAMDIAQSSNRSSTIKDIIIKAL